MPVKAKPRTQAACRGLHHCCDHLLPAGRTQLIGAPRKIPLPCLLGGEVRYLGVARSTQKRAQLVCTEAGLPRLAELPGTRGRCFREVAVCTFDVFGTRHVGEHDLATAAQRGYKAEEGFDRSDFEILREAQGRAERGLGQEAGPRKSLGELAVVEIEWHEGEIFRLQQPALPEFSLCPHKA